MADLEKIISKYQDQIKNSGAETARPGKIARLGPTRPWNRSVKRALPPQTTLSTHTFSPSSKDSSHTEPRIPWYASAHAWIELMRFRSRVFVTFLCTNVCVLGFLAYSYPSQFSSLTQIYAPEAKEEALTPRLGVLANDPKIVSFPEPRHVPMRFVTQNVKTPEFLTKIASAYLAQQDANPQFDPRKISLGTEYNPSTELFLIRVFYPDPWTAAELANLYARQFQELVQQSRLDYYAQVRSWITRMTEVIQLENQKLEGELEGLKTKTSASSLPVDMKMRYARAFAEKEMQILSLKNEVEALERALASEDSHALYTVSIEDIQALKTLRKKITQLQGSSTQGIGKMKSIPQELRQIDEEARSLIKTQLAAKTEELNELKQGLAPLRQQVRRSDQQEGHSREITNMVQSVQSRININNSYLATLGDLLSELDLKSNYAPAPISILQKGYADPSSRTPKQLVKILFVFVGTLFLSLSALFILQILKPQPLPNSMKASAP